MEKLFDKIPFVDQVLKGVGQIMLQENRWTGLLFLTGIFWGSWQCGVAAILATATGTLTAKLLHYGEKEISAGLYGFSAALLGVALAFLFQTTVLIWAFIIVGAVLAAVLQHFFIQRKFPVFTLPFILITWGSVYLLHHFIHAPASEMLPVKLKDPMFRELFTAVEGYSEVIFQGSPVSGLVFFLAVFISSPIAALYGLVASLLSASISVLNGEELEEVHMGLFGFNAVLTAIVFSGPKKTDGLWVLIAVVITAVINDLLVDEHLLDPVGGVFTFPFVAGTWLTLLLQKLFLKKAT